MALRIEDEPNMKRTIEIEFRAMFQESVYLRLRKFLLHQGKYLGKDDKDVHFYLFPDRLYKVVDNVSKKNARLVLKKNRIGRGSSFEEVEIPIPRRHVMQAVALFDSLKAPQTDHEFQSRQNFIWRGVEIALKHSGTWGFHAEFEIVVNGPKDQLRAEKRIYRVAELLGVHLMTDNELKVFFRSVARRRKFHNRRKR